MATQIQIRRDTAAAWAAADPVLAQGEWGFVTDGLPGQNLRIGDGINPFSALVSPVTGGDVLPINTYAGSQTAGLVDAGSVMEITAAGTVTVPPQSSVPWETGAFFMVRRATADPVSVAGDSGVDVRKLGTGAIPEQWAEMSLHRRGEDEWVAAVTATTSLNIIEVTASRDLAASDTDAIVENRGATTFTITVQPQASVAIPEGRAIGIASDGTGGITVANGAGVDVVNLGTVPQDGFATLVRITGDRWLMVGNQA